VSSFTTALIARKSDGRLWQVYLPFSYEVGSLGSGEIITVPAGFITDLASIPRLAWWLLPPDDSYSQAAVLHDWLCHRRGNVERQYTSRQVAEIFEEAMGVLRVTPWKRALMFRAVLWFGPRW
jgi:hypothetical protein